jgi:hypothetical protein
MNVITLTKPGRQGVSFEAVAATAEKIAAEGGTPTLRGIRERLGMGSLGTIQAHLKAWKDGHAPAVMPANVTLPEALQASLLAEIDRQVRQGLAGLKAELTEVRRERDELAEENARLEGIITDMKEELDNVKEHAARMDEQAKSHANLQQKETFMRERAERECQTARVEVQAAQARLEQAAREIEFYKERETKASNDARKAFETAAELRGKLELLMELPSPTKTQKSPEKRNERKSV